MMDDSMTPSMVLSNHTNPSRHLRLTYRSAFAAIALLAIAALALTEVLILTNTGTGVVINIAGRQRMLSQRIAKAAERGDLQQLADAAELLARSHAGLTRGDESMGLSGRNSAQAGAMYRNLEPHLDSMLRASRKLLESEETQAESTWILNEIREHEVAFLPLMNAIVHQYETEAADRETAVHIAQIAICLLTLSTLGIIGWKVLEPACSRLEHHWLGLRESELRFQLAVKGSRDAIWDWNLRTNIIYFAPAWSEMFDDPSLADHHSPEAWLSLIASAELNRFDRALDAVKRGSTDLIDIELEMRTRSGDEIWVICRGAVHRDAYGNAERLVGSLADITDLRQTREMLRELAETDGLTGLVNRSKFRERVDIAITRRGQGSSGSFAVMYFDFDGFKAVNDALGHTVGDELLVSIGNRLRKILPDHAVIARLGGDEFAVLLNDVPRDLVLSLSESLLAELALPHNLGGQRVVSTASIGLVFADPTYDAAEEVLRDADAAMYAAKANGRNQVKIFDTAMLVSALERLNLETSLRDSSFDDDFEVRFQPIVFLDSGETEGFEALLRWPEAQQRGHSPDAFIKAAEDTGVIIELGQWVLNESAKALIACDQATGHHKTIMHVNVSKRQLLHPSFVASLATFKRTFPQIDGRIVLEITETAVMDPRANAIPRMHELRELGFPIAMDDFGTGHSSLSCLHQFPLDILKIDRSFILNVESRREFSAIYHSIVSLAGNLDLQVVAEGIETDGQLVQMQAMGTALGQGYFFEKAIRLDEALRYLTGDAGQRNAA